MSLHVADAFRAAIDRAFKSYPAEPPETFESYLRSEYATEALGDFLFGTSKVTFECQVGWLRQASRHDPKPLYDVVAFMLQTAAKKNKDYTLNIGNGITQSSVRLAVQSKDRASGVVNGYEWTLTLRWNPVDPSIKFAKIEVDLVDVASKLPSEN